MSSRPEVKGFIQSFEVLVFDMGDTFMFNADRFSADQDFQAIYRSLGGTRLTNEQLIEVIDRMYRGLLALARDEGNYTSYPTLDAFIKNDPWFSAFPGPEQDLFKQVFAAQECGRVPGSASRVLQALSRHHRLGLVSNVWADKSVFCRELKRSGVYDLFEILVFSSEQGVIKPEPGIFRPVIDHFKKPADQLVYIGNSYKRDIRGAAGTGMRTILVDNGPASEITGDTEPDYTIRSIEELV
jgi:FMN phosphatase YigB (HAD superfamily)